MKSNLREVSSDDVELQDLMEHPDKLELHPAVFLTPPFQPEEFQALKLDIERNGLLEPGVAIREAGQWLLLDGRHRRDVCVELGLKLDLVVYTGDNPIDFVTSTHVRRNINASQRAVQGLRLRQASNTGMTPLQAARIVGTSSRYVWIARLVQKELGEDVLQSVWLGHEVLSKLYREIRPKPVSIPPEGYLKLDSKPNSGSDSNPVSNSKQEPSKPPADSPSSKPSPNDALELKQCDEAVSDLQGRVCELADEFDKRDLDDATREQAYKRSASELNRRYWDLRNKREMAGPK